MKFISIHNESPQYNHNIHNIHNIHNHHHHPSPSIIIILIPILNMNNKIKILENINISAFK